MAASVLLFMCTAGISVSAAPFSIQRLEDRINSSEISFSYTYSVSGGKVSMTGQGSAVLQGDAYILDVDGMEVYCDGTARWTLDRKAEELIQEGYRPWGAPSFITHNEQIKVCQAFIRKEEI